MSATIVAIEAGTKIIEIICTKYVENEKDKRAQRYKLTIKKKVQEEGRSFEVELTAEFGTEEKMIECTNQWQRIAPAAKLTNEVVKAIK